jgi:hypothetical protein
MTHPTMTPRERIAALELVTDQQLLAALAKADKDARVRRTAVERLTDQKLLAEIAKTAKPLYDPIGVRRAAVERVADQSLLADIAKNAKDLMVREAAVRRVTEKPLLADIAATRSRRKTRAVALAVAFLFSLLLATVVLGVVAHIKVAPRKQLEAAKHVAILRIVDDVKALIPVGGGPLQAKKIPVVGSAVAWDKLNDWTIDVDGTVLTAKSATVFMVYDVSYPVVGRYVASNFQGTKRLPDIEKPAYGIAISVAVAYWPEKKLAGFFRTQDPSPSDEKLRRYGFLRNWIDSFPRDAT